MVYLTKIDYKLIDKTGSLKYVYKQMNDYIYQIKIYLK